MAVIKKKEPIVTRPLERDAVNATPVDVMVDVQSTTAKLSSKSGSYTYNLKLEAPNTFNLVKSVRISTA